MNDSFAVVVGVGRAEGSKAAAAALACAGAGPDRASLLIDLGGRAPRPTLVASSAARRLEERLTVHLPEARVASRGLVCHVSLSLESEWLASLVAMAPLVRDAVSVLHVSQAHLQSLLEDGAGLELSAALLRADLDRDRALTSLIAADLISRDLRVGVLKQPLGWVASRRALFGSLPPDAPGGLPARLRRQIGMSHECYVELDDSKADPTRAAQPEWGDHESARSWR